MSQKRYLGLDIGETRTGVAVGDQLVKIAVPLLTIAMKEVDFRFAVAELVTQHDITDIVIGFPRNQSGEATQQTQFVQDVAAELRDIDATIHFQDESLTSVIAEQRLAKKGQVVDKGAIDREAAAIILQDFMEAHA